MFKFTEKKFAKEIGNVAKSIDSSLRYTYLPDSREVKLMPSDGVGGKPYTIFLGNIFLKVYEMPKKERLLTIEAFLREVLTPKELSSDKFMASLSLRVRTDFEIGLRNRHIELQGHEAPSPISFRQGKLVIEIVSDREETVSLAQADDLSEIGITEQEAIRMASAKLRRSTGGDQWEHVGESIWISRYCDDYDFARLLAAEDFNVFPFEEPPIVFAPSHSICLVTNSMDAGVLTKMVELGNERSANHRPFCQLLWTLENGEWKEWRPDPTSASWVVAELQVVRETVNRYDDTKNYLEQSFGEDVFVATYRAIQNDNGLTCYCVYTFDLPSYLPLTDFVVIIDSELPEGENVVGQIDWHEFKECIGSGAIERAENMNPVWYRVMKPLDASQKDRILQLARPIN